MLYDIQNDIMIFRTLVYLEPLVYSDEKTTNLFNWYFSQLIYTLLQQTKYRKLILPLTSSICLFIYLLIYKYKEGSQTFKSSSCNNYFLQWVCYCYNLLWWMFFIPCNNWKTLLFTKVYRYSDMFLTTPLLLSLRPVLWKSPFFMRYLHNNSMMLTREFQTKAN